jgi:DNA-binding NtrC family response regulator
LLADHLIRRHNLEMKTRYKGVENTAIKALMALPWKGNIRELDNILERGMILGDGEWIRAKDLPRADVPENRALTMKDSLDEALEAYEKIHIENVLRELDGRQSFGGEPLVFVSQNRQARNRCLAVYYGVKQPQSTP